MTIEDLLGYSTDDLEAMTQEKYTELLSPYFQYTRPEQVPVTSDDKPKKSKNKDVKAAIERVNKRSELLQMMQKAGIGEVGKQILQGNGGK